MCEVLEAGLDCYMTMVDDQAIDAIIRVPSPKASPRYFDVQIKSARTWGSIRGKISYLSARPNVILVLCNSTTCESFWLDADGIKRFFAPNNSPWGDIFLNAAQISTLRAEYTLGNLRERLGI